MVDGSGAVSQSEVARGGERSGDEEEGGKAGRSDGRKSSMSSLVR